MRLDEHVRTLAFVANAHDQPVAAIDLPCQKPPTATRLHQLVHICDSLRFCSFAILLLNHLRVKQSAGVSLRPGDSYGKFIVSTFAISLRNQFSMDAA